MQSSSKSISYFLNCGNFGAHYNDFIGDMIFIDFANRLYIYIKMRKVLVFHFFPILLYSSSICVYVTHQTLDLFSDNTQFIL